MAALLKLSLVPIRVPSSWGRAGLLPAGTASTETWGWEDAGTDPSHTQGRTEPCALLRVMQSPAICCPRPSTGEEKPPHTASAAGAQPQARGLQKQQQEALLGLGKRSMSGVMLLRA